MINFITLLRVVLLAPLAWLLVNAGEKTWAVEGIFLLAGVTDWADGYLARRLRRTSKFGAMLDQICDKIFIIGTLVAMAAAGLLQNVMLIPVLLIIAREFAVAGWREYMAQQGRAVPVDKLGKLKTVTQFFGLALMLVPVAGDVCIEINHVGAAMVWISAIMGLVSAVNYFRAGMKKVPGHFSAE